MMTSIVVLFFQLHNFKFRSSKLIIKSDAQKQMIECGFGRRFHDVKYFEGENLSCSLNSLST